MSSNVNWKDAYRMALIEVDYALLPERLNAADRAIESRMGELANLGDGAEERREMQGALRNLNLLRKELREAALSTWADHADIGGEYMVFVDNKRRYVEVTEGVCNLLGYSRDELLGKTIDQITAPELRPDVGGLFDAYVSRGTLDGKFTLLAKNGQRVHILYESRAFPDGCLVARWKPV